MGDAFRILDLISADEDTDHAVDVSEEEAWAIIGRLRGSVKVLAYLMLVIGTRCKDQEHIQIQDLLFRPDGSMIVYFRWTKNHRDSKKRYSIIVRPKIFIRELLDAVTAAPRESRLFRQGIEVTELNSALSEATDGKPGVTSYSLRRRFIHNCIAGATVGETTKWLDVAALTGHYDLEVLRNSYAEKFTNTL